MTKVVFYKSNGIYYGFDVEGHTGLADAGEDILCAAISSMTMFVINAIEHTYHSSAVYTVDEDHATITLKAPGAFINVSDEKTAFAVSGLITAYCKQLYELQDDYKKYLKVTEVEKNMQ